MKAIVYASIHHGNTKKIVDAIAEKFEVELIDATKVKQKDLSNYDAIGFASGIYYSKFHQSVLKFASDNLPEGKKVFLISTSGSSTSYKSIEEVIDNKHGRIMGKFNCKGYDTYGPFKLFGGIAKGHPNEKDIENAISFFEGLE